MGDPRKYDFIFTCKNGSQKCSKIDLCLNSQYFAELFDRHDEKFNKLDLSYDQDVGLIKEVKIHLKQNPLDDNDRKRLFQACRARKKCPLTNKNRSGARRTSYTGRHLAVQAF